MDPLLNPFVPGAGSRPPALVGRDEDLDKIRLLISRLSLGRQQRSLLLTGLRGVGKTVLLNEFESLAKNAGWATALREVPSEHLVFKDMIAESVRKTLIEISKDHGLGADLKRAFGVLRSFRPKVSASVAASGSIEYSLSIEPVNGVADSGNVSEDLSDLLEEVGLAARGRSTGVFLLFDEVQNLSRSDLGALILALHRVSQKNVPVAAVAAGLPTLPTPATEAASYAERLFEFRRLDRLGRKDAGLALTLPSAPTLSWTAEALQMALDEADGYPYFL